MLARLLFVNIYVKYSSIGVILEYNFTSLCLVVILTYIQIILTTIEFDRLSLLCRLLLLFISNFI